MVRTALIERGAIAILTIALAAWFVVSLHDAHALRSARGIADAAAPTQKEIRHALASLRGTASGHPGDTEPDLVRATLLLRAGRPRAALSVLESIVRREPDNLRAMFTLAVVAPPIDPALGRMALRRAAALNPAGGRNAWAPPR